MPSFIIPSHYDLIAIEVELKFHRDRLTETLDMRDKILSGKGDTIQDKLSYMCHWLFSSWEAEQMSKVCPLQTVSRVIQEWEWRIFRLGFYQANTYWMPDPRAKWWVWTITGSSNFFRHFSVPQHLARRARVSLHACIFNFFCLALINKLKMLAKIVGLTLKLTK